MGANVEGQTEERARGAVATWLLWTGVVLLIYILSAGPVALLESKKVFSPGLERGLGAVYDPLAWAYQKTPLHKPIGVYLHLWVPKQFDRNGDFMLVLHP